MSSLFHTPLAPGGPLSQVAMEQPLGQLDAAIAAIDASLDLVVAAGSSASTTLTVQANAGSSGPFTVASTTGFLPGDFIYFGNGTTFEARIINTVPSGTTFTTTAVLTNTYAIGKPVSKTPVELVEARSGLATLNTRLAAMEGGVSVRAFGAKGDGVTNDAAAFQAAHDSLPATGGTIFVPPGIYLGSTTVPMFEITKSGVRIVGAGRGNTVLKFPNTSTNKYLINSTAAINDLYIGRLEIDGNAANNAALTGAEGIRIVGPTSRRVTIEDVYVHDIKGSAGDESLAINLGNVVGGRYLGLHVKSCGGSGIAISGSDDILVANCIAESNGWMGFTFSINTVPTTNLEVVNCLSKLNTKFGFNFESVHYATLAGLHAVGNGEWGLVFNAAGGLPFCHHITGASIVARNNGTVTGRAGILITGDGATGANNINLAGVIATDTQVTKTQTHGVEFAGQSFQNTVAGDLRGNKVGEVLLLQQGVNNQYRPARGIFARIAHSANQSIATGAGYTNLDWDTDTTDKDGLHYTSASALTGTVAKTNGSPTLTGTGTAFLTELSPGQVIDVAGVGFDRKVIKSIETNTSLTVFSNYAATAAGVTGFRVRAAVGFHLGGLYGVEAHGQYAANATGARELQIWLNDVTSLERKVVGNAGAGDPTQIQVSTKWEFTEGDYIIIRTRQTSGGALNLNAAAFDTPTLLVERR